MLFFSILVFYFSIQQYSLNSSVYNWGRMTESRSLPGKKRSFFDGSTTVFAEIEMHATTLFTGNKRTPVVHNHPEHEELVIVKEGTLDATLNKTRTIVKAGSIILLCRGDKHIVSNGSTDKTATYFIFRWKTRKPPSNNANPVSKVYHQENSRSLQNEKPGIINILNRPTSLLNSLNVSLLTLLPDTEIQVSDVGETFFIVKNGTTEIKLSGKSETVSSGTVIYAAVNEICKFTNKSKIPCEIYSIICR
jgi:quercetin dioxygenase-like cupin family protein